MLMILRLVLNVIFLNISEKGLYQDVICNNAIVLRRTILPKTKRKYSTNKVNETYYFVQLV